MECLLENSCVVQESVVFISDLPLMHLVESIEATSNQYNTYSLVRCHWFSYARPLLAQSKTQKARQTLRSSTRITHVTKKDMGYDAPLSHQMVSKPRSLFGQNSDLPTIRQSIMLQFMISRWPNTWGRPEFSNI